MKPKVYFVGSTQVNWSAIREYLTNNGLMEFWGELQESGVTGIEALCSIYAKLCYKSFTVAQNPNVTAVRSIKDNFIKVLESGHHSIFDHIQFNFIISPCSRVFTHEMVRHRIGVAYSQTSGRYVNLADGWDVMDDDSLAGLRDKLDDYKELSEQLYRDCAEALRLDDKPFTEKKKLTSALRRHLVPSGVANELGMSLNLRAVRHVIQMRTSRHAEWEIRDVFNQVYDLLREQHKLIFHDAKEEMVDGYREIRFGT